MSRRDPDFGLKKSIEDIFDGAEMPDDVRAAIEEAEKVQQFPEPVLPDSLEEASNSVLPVPLVEPDPPKTLGPKRPLRIEKPAPVEYDPADLEPDMADVEVPSSPEVEDRGLSSEEPDQQKKTSHKLKIGKPTPVESDPADFEPDLSVVEAPSSPAVEDRGLGSDIRKDEIEQLKTRLKCPKEFECCESGFTVLCKTRLTLGGLVVECVGKDQKSCRFRRSIFGKGLCGCRMRQYIARKLGL